MVPDWLLGATGTWVGPLLLVVTVVIAGVGFVLLTRLLGGNGQRAFGADQIRREMLDECFAKGEKLREDCEERCKGMGHPREPPRPSVSAPPDLPL